MKQAIKDEKRAKIKDSDTENNDHKDKKYFEKNFEEIKDIFTSIFGDWFLIIILNLITFF